MATFHCQIKPISRKDGRSAVASAAYRSATRLKDRAQDVTHDYTARQHDVLRTWRSGITWRWTWRSTGRERVSDDRNYHAHIMTTTREVTSTGLGRKTDIELSHEDRKAKGLESVRNEIRSWRKQWEWRANAALKEYGHTAQIDSRSLKHQGIDRKPKRYLGRQVTEERVRKARAQQAEKTRPAEPAREPPRPMTEAEQDALIEARWLQRKKAQENAPSVEERWLARREERLRDPEGYRKREREKELAQMREQGRDRSRERGE